MENKPDFDKCLECGADSGLHQYETEKCPRFGREETRVGFSQEWANTIFRPLDMQAYELGEAKTASERDRLKEDIVILKKRIEELENLLNTCEKTFGLIHTIHTNLKKCSR